MNTDHPTLDDVVNRLRALELPAFADTVADALRAGRTLPRQALDLAQITKDDVTAIAAALATTDPATSVAAPSQQEETTDDPDHHRERDTVG